MTAIETLKYMVNKAESEVPEGDELVSVNIPVDILKEIIHAHQWIPCSERLPEEGMNCLVCDKGSVAIDTFIGQGNPYNWKWYVRDYEAWMPLPDPWRGEEHERG